MEITKPKVIRIIQDTLIKNRAKSINAVRLSNMIVDDNISQRDLFRIVMNQLEAGNDKLIFNLGYVIDDTFDMSGVKSENFSGFNFTMSNPDAFNEMNTTTTPTKPASRQNSWWSQNSGNVLTAGVSLLGGLFGGGKSSPAPTPPPTGGNNNAMIAMMNAQNQQAAQAAQMANQRAAEDSARRSSNMMIFGVVGGVVLIGGIMAIVLTRK